MFDIPENIKKSIEDEKYVINDMGMSGSTIMVFKGSDRVLKIQENSEEAENEVQAMKWISGWINEALYAGKIDKRFFVPKVILHECKGTKSYLLMTRAYGVPACNEWYMCHPEYLTGLLAQALQELWQVDISDCPLDWTLERKLKAAEYNVKNNLVDIENVDPDTFGPEGFENPQALLKWLYDHKPEEELVFSHGDFCLPNIFIDEDDDFEFIDLGRTGIADKWQDIALCYRSLKHNYSGKYGGKEYPEYDPNMLFDKLGIAPDWDKLRYYILLDELF